MHLHITSEQLLMSTAYCMCSLEDLGDMRHTVALQPKALHTEPTQDLWNRCITCRAQQLTDWQMSANGLGDMHRARPLAAGSVCWGVRLWPLAQCTRLSRPSMTLSGTPPHRLACVCTGALRHRRVCPLAAGGFPCQRPRGPEHPARARVGRHDGDGPDMLLLYLRPS